MKHNIHQYYEAVLGITRKAGEVRPQTCTHSPVTLKHKEIYLLGYPVLSTCRVWVAVLSLFCRHTLRTLRKILKKKAHM
jgi:hypothetical protein